MTSRERVRAALNHKQPDRVPVDFGSTMVTGISVSVISKLRKVLGLDGPNARVKVIEPSMRRGYCLAIVNSNVGVYELISRSVLFWVGVT